jgi:hypothetical protein
MLKQLDLIVLAVALPIFIFAGFPLLGYAAAAGAWLVSRAIQAAAERHAANALVEHNRRSALGGLAAALLGRLWLVTLTILLVGTLGEREDGLAAAVLCAVLVTAYLVTRALTQLQNREAPR